MAVAADPKFKTFEAACPYVIQKLLTDNSAGTRKILHSVVFNKRKEFQWQRLALFLRLGATSQLCPKSSCGAMTDSAMHLDCPANVEMCKPWRRQRWEGKALQPMVTSKTSLDYSPEGATSVINATNLVLRLLISKDGVVLRRLLMTAEGILFRQHLCRIIADVMCQWVGKHFGGGFTRHGSLVRFKSGTASFEIGSPSRISAPICDYQSILSDRRVKVILLDYLKSARRDPILMLRLCWASISLLAAASALACHRMLVSLSETYLGPPSFAPKQFAASA
ncbi:hypothetical protein RJ639_033643 [Escallonia herrerae]|uniref:Uncharacterized protein n=1 Tax=Escallonia herrerae TaxID=1293975 RepID=A0AA88WYI2_9ASTE|nr:hypothetical protein RJ639_033643 [Escallonia herrerae]